MTAFQCGRYINHAVQLVGLDLEGKYWRIRNSWGVGWGDQGFIDIEYGTNACYIEYMSLYTDAITVK
jgi:C1A family cysteine protease